MAKRLKKTALKRRIIALNEELGQLRAELRAAVPETAGRFSFMHHAGNILTRQGWVINEPIPVIQDHGYELEVTSRLTKRLTEALPNSELRQKWLKDALRDDQTRAMFLDYAQLLEATHMDRLASAEKAIDRFFGWMVLHGHSTYDDGVDTDSGMWPALRAANEAGRPIMLDDTLELDLHRLSASPTVDPPAQGKEEPPPSTS